MSNKTTFTPEEWSVISGAPHTVAMAIASAGGGVMGAMKSLRLGVVEDFPFLDAPSGRAIADGYQLLNELGAVDEANELTSLGRELARLPLDPALDLSLL